MSEREQVARLLWAEFNTSHGDPERVRWEHGDADALDPELRIADRILALLKRLRDE